MRAEDLQIGDYIQNPLGLIGRVQSIKYMRKDSGDVYGGHYFVTLAFGESDQTFDIKDARPIPLTSEILEKNGFKYVSVIIVGTAEMRWVSEDTRTEITIWMDDTLPMEIVKNVYYEDEISYTLPFPGTVHQLQHALRLCEIDKQITL